MLFIILLEFAAFLLPFAGTIAGYWVAKKILLSRRPLSQKIVSLIEEILKEEIQKKAMQLEVQHRED